MGSLVNSLSIHETATRYRRLLMLATVSPLLAMILIDKFGHGNGWPWVVALPVAIGAWVVHDVRERDDAYRRLWNILAALPIALWLLYFVASLFID